MLHDATRLPDGASVEADVCIIGAGPAGMAVALALSASGRRVVILESGGVEPEDAPQALNQGAIVGSYAGLRQTRWRQVGGAARVWNSWFNGEAYGRLVPLDPWDFAAWPLTLADLTPWYEQAQAFLGIGRFEYDGAEWSRADRPLLPLGAGPFVSRIYQFGRRSRFADLTDRLRQSPTTDLYQHATVVGLALDSSRTRVKEVSAAGSDRSRFKVKASAVVLASGAIENARLLLLDAGAGLPPSPSIGSCFMEHPRDYSPVLEPASNNLATRMRFYDAHAAPDGTIVCGRLGLTVEAIREARVPNASVTFLPRERPRRGLARLTRWLRGRAPAGHGWSNDPDSARSFDGFRIVLNLEQVPRRENRVRLGPARDALGVPLPVLEWSWTAAEQEGLERLRGLLVNTFSRSELGRIRIQPGLVPDPNAHHHAGTTRMSAGPREGVVDQDCRVHGTENLYVAGASVFPSAGFANPTLTIVALALRLAAHLSAPSPPSPRTA